MVTLVEKTRSSFEPSLSTILHSFKHNANWEDALRLHSYICHSGLDADPLFGRCLIALFASLRSINDAKRVFDKLINPCEWSWIHLYKGYLKCGMPEHVISLHERMKKNGSCRNWSGYHLVCILNACKMLKDLKKGMEIHSEVIRAGSFEENIFVCAALVDMYVKCGSLARAQELFDRFSIRNVVLWTSLSSGYVECGKFEDALKYLEEMKVEGILPNVVTCIYRLKACGSLGDAHKIKQIHAEIEELGFLKVDIVGNTLIDMYAKCSLLADAHAIFEEILVRDVVSWTCLIAGYVDIGHCGKALDCYGCMQYEGIHPSAHTIVCVLKACASESDIMKGHEIHAEIVQRGLLESNDFIGGTLIDLYIKCGCLEQAQRVFDKTPTRSVVTWNTLIAGYADNGHCEEALRCLECMLHNEISPNAITFLYALKTYITVGAIDKGDTIHAEIARLGLIQSNLVIGNALVGMYAKFGFFAKAEEVFDNLPYRDIISWTSIIAGYADHGLNRNLQKCFHQMQLEGITPNVITFSCALKSVGTMEIVRDVHSEIESRGLEMGDPFIGNALLNVYAKNGYLGAAREVFDKLLIRNLVSWSVVIAGYVQHGYNLEALQCYKQMQTEGTFSDSITVLSILISCGSIQCNEMGREVHVDIQQRGLLERHHAVGIALLDMYAKCGSIVMAERVFDKLRVQDTTSWNVLIAGYIEHGLNIGALRCFKEMGDKGVPSDVVTFICCLRACGETRTIRKGQEIDAEIRKWGVIENDTVLCNSLVNMYLKCGSISVAQHMFDRILVRDVISWTTLIAGYAEHRHSEKALQCFELMQLEGISPNPITFSCILKACSNLKNLEKLQDLSNEIERQGLLKTDLVVGCALVYAYAKYGMLARAKEVFEELPYHDVVSWTALLTGYSEHGHAHEAFKCFQQMELEGVSSDSIKFVCSLRACGHVEAINKGKQLHCQITGNELLKSNQFVGSCLVDMYARYGLFVEAHQVFNSLSVQTVVTWTSLITGYANYGQGEEALKFFEKMQLQRVTPNAITIICILKACGVVGITSKGRELHDDIEKRGFLESDSVIGSSLVNMYAKCGSIIKAQEVFDNLEVRNVVSWTALMAGYAQIGQNENVFHIYDEMIGDGIQPNQVTFVVILNACSRLGQLHKSLLYFHMMSKDYCISPTIEHHSCMIDLVGRIGQLDKATTMIEEMPFRPNLVVWHSLLGACQKSGNLSTGKWAFQYSTDAILAVS